MCCRPVRAPRRRKARTASQTKLARSFERVCIAPAGGRGASARTEHIALFWQVRWAASGWDPAKKLRRRFLVAGMHSLPFEFPASLPPARPPRPPSVTESVERDAVLSGMRHLGSRKMRRFVNDNFLDAPVEMDEKDEEPFGLEQTGTRFSDPAVLMMIAAD